MTATNKWYSYPRATAIRIDIHPEGENPINTLHAFHASFTYGFGPCISCGPCRQPFASSHKVKTCPTPRRSLGDQRQTGLAVTLGHLIPSPMRQPWSRGERFRLSGYTATSTYWTHKHQYVIDTFNTCSRGLTHWSLIDIGGGCNLGGVSFPQTTPQPSRSTVSTFHLSAPPDLRISISTIANWT
jgi:hypothetical protein